MKPIHQKMNWQEYENFPWRLGWKHEYYGGEIHVTPSKVAIVTWKLVLQPRPDQNVSRFRPVEAKDQKFLAALFRLAFRDTVDYAGYPHQVFSQQAAKNIADYFTTGENPWASASCWVREANQAIAAALIRAAKQGPLLQPLFVRPAQQRQGWGTAVMKHVVNQLRQLGATHLYSHTHLGNPASMAWHQRFGFTEMPDEWVASHRAQYYGNELERHQRLADLSSEEEARLAEQANYWAREWNRLATLADADFGAAHPSLRLL